MGDQDSQTRLAHRRVELRGARYLGGHPQRPRAESTRFFYLTQKGVEFRTGLTPVTVPWDTVTTLVIAGPGEVDGWTLVTDDLAPAGETAAYLRIDAKVGSLAFEVPGVTPDALRGLLEPVAHLVALPDVLGGPAQEDEVDVDLDTKQMAALGLDGLVEESTTEETGEAALETSDELDPSDGDPTPAVDEAESLDAGTEDGAESVADQADGEVGEVTDVAEAQAADESVDEVDEDDPVEEAADAVLAEEASVHDTEASAEDPPDLSTAEDPVEEPVPGEADIVAAVVPEVDDAGEPPSASAEEPLAEEPVLLSETDVADELDVNDEDLELDDLQLTALGIDEPAESNNGPSPVSSLHDLPTSAGEPGCPNGHTNPYGARFCLQCGASMQSPACPQGHTNPPGAAFCGECGASLRVNGGAIVEATELELRQEALRVGEETLRRMQSAQQDEIRPLLREVGSLPALASDQRVLPLRKSLHEQHITTMRAKLALAEALRDAGQVSGEEAEALIALRRTELDFAIQMLLEVTELIALPGNDEEGRDLVRQHMAEIFAECDEKRRAAQLHLAQTSGEPHAIRAAELESDLEAKAAELRALRGARKPDPIALWRLKDEFFGLRVTQLTERRAAAIAQADVAGTDEADAMLADARDAAKRHARHAPAQATKISRFEAEMMTGLSTVITGGQRVPRSADRRVAAAKRAVAEFRDFFDTHPAPAIGVHEQLLDQLASEWEEYNRVSRQFVGTPTVVPGRSSQRTKVQWIKYDQMIVNTWLRRVGVVSAELEVSEAAGDTDRHDGLAKLLEVVTEALRLASQAAKVEVPAV